MEYITFDRKELKRAIETSRLKEVAVSLPLHVGVYCIRIEAGEFYQNMPFDGEVRGILHEGCLFPDRV